MKPRGALKWKWQKFSFRDQWSQNVTYLIVSVKLQQLPVILQENCSLLPLCRPTVPVCGRCDGTLYTGWRTRAQTSAFGRSSQTGDFCPASAQRCSIPGNPRGPGRPARSPSRCWSAWNELSCRTGSQCSPREIESHRELYANAFL